jgi:hypothetical protein
MNRADWRMILIVRSELEHRDLEIGDVVGRLTAAGEPVTLTRSPVAAYRMIRELEPAVVLLTDPRVERCPYLLCGWVGELERAPRMVAVARIEEPDQRVQCEACLTVLSSHAAPSRVAATVLGLAREVAAGEVAERERAERERAAAIAGS